MVKMINLTEMSKNDLVVLKGLIDKEMLERKNKERDKLIENFQKAFYDLLDVGVEIDYDYCGDALTDWDSFYFN